MGAGWRFGARIELNVGLVHHQLHGYRKGHELLASSVPLVPEDQELITRLSDLSGPLIRDAEFIPYLSAYPIPSKTYYALAKTWLDKTAPRSGCVLTHTVLIPIDLWTRGFDPLQIYGAFRADRGDLEFYQRELVSDESNHEANEFLELSALDRDEFGQFVNKYFGAGINPVVWFRDSDSNSLLLHLLRGLWPALRRSFSVCSFSLQSRSLNDKSFDLLFAPTSSYSRFSRLPRENILDGSAKVGSSVSAPWNESLVMHFLGTSNSNLLKMQVAKDTSLLDSDPTSIRRLFLLDELGRRATKSPTAVVGMLDLVESLASVDDVATLLRPTTILNALSLAANQQSSEGIKSVELIAERLTHDMFEGLARAVESELSNAVEKLAAENATVALESLEELLGKVDRNSISVNAFTVGVIKAMGRPGPSNELEKLRDFPSSARKFFETNPKTLTAYLDSNVGIDQAAKDVSSWMRAVENQYSLQQAREVVIPWLRHSSQLYLVDEVINGLEQDGVERALALYFSGEAPESLSGESRTFLCSVAEKYPDQVREWANSQLQWPDVLSAAVAESFGRGGKGIKDALQDSTLSDEHKATVIAYLLTASGGSTLAIWASKLVKEDERIFAALLRAKRPTSKLIEDCFSRICSNVEHVPAIALDPIQETLKVVEESGIRSELQDLVFRTLLSSQLIGQQSSSAIAAVAKIDDWQSWIRQVNGFQVVEVIRAVGGGKLSAEAWRGIWIWLLRTSAASQLDAHRTILPVVDFLLANRPKQWPAETSVIWEGLLEWSQEVSPSEDAADLCAQALKFCLSNNKLPLSGVVAMAFPPVYEMIMAGDDRMASIIFTYYHWNKGDELRRVLVDSFMSSKLWSPADLAVTAEKSFGLRKLYKRVSRKFRGDDYIAKIVADLGEKAGERELTIRDELVAIAGGPYFYEDWD
ncbi:MAG: hypothetical protein JW384_00367 [Nitrosomonadaceae bacterium]|nr:hypothetical protein [Nitrosomonadaceae bacterium]